MFSHTTGPLVASVSNPSWNLLNNSFRYSESARDVTQVCGRLANHETKLRLIGDKHENLTCGRELMVSLREPLSQTTPSSHVLLSWPCFSCLWYWPQQQGDVLQPSACQPDHRCSSRSQVLIQVEALTRQVLHFFSEILAWPLMTRW